MKALLTIAVCSLVVAAAPTQGDARSKIKKKVEAMRKAMREGKIRKLNVYVKVRLNNGNRLKGVVKSGKFVELPDGIDFVSAAQADSKHAGMRVWYTAGTTSFVFLRYEEIEHYSIGSRLSDDQVKAIELKLAQELTETQENYRRMRKARRNKNGEKDPGEKKDGETEDKDAPPDLDSAQLKLLQSFPPVEGWGEEKIQRLKTRRITLGVYPNKKEQEFEKVFSSWKVAYEAHQKVVEYKKKKTAKSAAKKADKKTAKSKGSEKPKDSVGTPPGFGGKPPK